MRERPMAELRIVQVYRGQWLQVRLSEVKKGERFRMFEGGNQLCDAVAISDGYNVARIGAIEANVIEIMLCEQGAPAPRMSRRATD